MERDRTFHFVFVLNFQISTHTLTWSVTLLLLIPFSMFANFNSHAHVERDVPHNYTLPFFENYFNSHAHVERDELTLALEYSDSNFNSHAHVERDKSGSISIKTAEAFQLTRSRGA